MPVTPPTFGRFIEEGFIEEGFFVDGYAAGISRYVRVAREPRFVTVPQEPRFVRVTRERGRG